MIEEGICLQPLMDVADLIRTREISPLEVTQAVLQRIKRLNPSLNCFITILEKQSLSDAQSMEDLLQNGTYLGPLHGIPISLKDSIATANVLTTAGSPILADWVPEVSATVVERLQAAGSVILGKANLYEFAYGQPHPNYGLTRNPWSFEHNCGGTSSGSASGIASGLGYGSIGTDAAGSIRIPAAFCGVVGLKPTFGLVSRAHMIPGSSNLDCAGPLTRTVRDTAAILQAIAGFDPADASTLRHPLPDFMAHIEDGLKGLRLGVLSHLDSEPIDPEVKTAFQQACSLLEQEGAIISSVRLPDPIQTRTVLWTIFATETATYHRPYLRSRAAKDYSPLVRTNLQIGEFIPATVYVQAQRVRQRMIAEFRDLLANVDAMVMPGVPFPAYPIDPDAQDTLSLGETKIENLLELKTRYTAFFNLTGQPAIVLPCGFSSNGLPISLQIVGKPLDDALVLRIARAYERITEWHQRRPRL